MLYQRVNITSDGFNPFTTLKRIRAIPSFLPDKGSVVSHISQSIAKTLGNVEHLSGRKRRQDINKEDKLTTNREVTLPITVWLCLNPSRIRIKVIIITELHMCLGLLN